MGKSGFRSSVTAQKRLDELGIVARGLDGAPVEARWADGVDPVWLDDLEYIWSTRTRDKADALDVRAKRRTRQAHKVADEEPSFAVILLRSAEWAEHRAQAMRMRRADLVDACGRRFRSVECGCGPRDAQVMCEQPQLCGECRRKHAMVWRKRLGAGLEKGLRRERLRYWSTPRYRRRGMVPGVYLVTLTGPHSGDIATDRVVMGRAVRVLLKHANRMGWWSTYAYTWEVTPGDDGLGHVHCHMAVISSWLPFSTTNVEHNDPEVWCPARRKVDKCGRVRWQTRSAMLKSRRGLHEVWRDALPGALVLDVQPPKRGNDSNEAFSAAWYLSKYVTKGVEPAVFTGTKAGELLVALAGRRKVSTSAEFYIPPITECECCGEEYRSLGAPVSLRELNPGAFIRTWIPYSSSQPAQMNMSGRRTV